MYGEVLVLTMRQVADRHVGPKCHVNHPTPLLALRPLPLSPFASAHVPRKLHRWYGSYGVIVTM